MGRKNDYSRVRTEDELTQALLRQIGHMRRSADLFDNGVYEEAERLANVVYILMHKGWGRTKSLLSQLGLLDKMTFPSTGTKSINYYHFPLCQVLIQSDSVRYHPVYDGSGVPCHKSTSQNFEEWWNGIIYTQNSSELTRKNLTLGLRLQDGGGHVDSEITNEEYDLVKTVGNDALCISNGQVVTFGLAAEGLSSEELQEILSKPPYAGNPPIDGGHWAAMRQIAWELNEALVSLGY